MQAYLVCPTLCLGSIDHNLSELIYFGKVRFYKRLFSSDKKYVHADRFGWMHNYPSPLLPLNGLLFTSTAHNLCFKYVERPKHNHNSHGKLPLIGITRLNNHPITEDETAKIPSASRFKQMGPRHF